MIVVDSSVWINGLRDVDTRQIRILWSGHIAPHILLGDLVLMELLQGARNDAHSATMERWLRRFPVAQMLDDELAVAAARNFRRLRSLGRTVRKPNDLLIATFCIEGGHELLHDDRDFIPFEDHLDLRAISA